MATTAPAPELKPPMPEIAPKLTVAIPDLTATLMLDLERYSSGSMLMKFEDTTARLVSGDVQVGEIGMAIGGTLFVEVGDVLYSLDKLAIWRAVEAAHKAAAAATD